MYTPTRNFDFLIFFIVFFYRFSQPIFVLLKKRNMTIINNY